MDFKKYTPHITTHNQTFVYDFAYILTFYILKMKSIKLW